MAAPQRNVTPMPFAADRPLAARLARFAVGVDAHALPAEVLAKARGCLLDFLGCALEAQDLPWGKQTIAYAGLGPKGPSGVVGSGLLVAATEAALANGALGHGLIREDMHVGSCCHLGVVVWPTLLALVQTRAVSGADLLAAAVAGYEVGGRVGRALFDADLAAKLRPTGTIGAIAGAAAAARLLRLTEEQATSAIGLAANMAGGVNEWPWAGGTEVFFHAGIASRNAVTAALLAELGTFASPTALDGRAGLFAAYGKRDKAAAVTPLADRRYEIMEVYWKPAPACNYVQTPCQAALALVAQGVEAKDVRRIRVASFRHALEYPGCDQQGPFPGVLEAKMSIQYAVAAALVRKEVSEANYARLDDPQVLRLAAVTELSRDAALEAAYPEKQGVEISVELADGTVRTARLAALEPVDEAGVRARFLEISGRKLGAGAGAEIVAALDAMPQAGDPAALAARAAARP